MNAEHPSLSKPLVVDKLTYFYNSKSSHSMVQLTRLESKKSHSLLFALLSAFHYASCLLWKTYPKASYS